MESKRKSKMIVGVATGVAIGALAVGLGIGIPYSTSLNHDNDKTNTSTQTLPTNLNTVLTINANNNYIYANTNSKVLISLTSSLPNLTDIDYHWYHNDKLVSATSKDYTINNSNLTLNANTSNSGFWRLAITGKKDGVNTVYYSNQVNVVVSTNYNNLTTGGQFSASLNNVSYNNDAIYNLNTNLKNIIFNNNLAFSNSSLIKNGASISFDWYSNSVASTTNGTLLSNTSSGSYVLNTLPTTTTYYYSVAHIIFAGYSYSVTSNIFTLNVVNNSNFTSVLTISSNSVILDNDNFTTSPTLTISNVLDNTLKGVTVHFNYELYRSSSNSYSGVLINTNSNNTFSLTSSDFSGARVYYLYGSVAYTYTLNGVNYNGVVNTNLIAFTVQNATDVTSPITISNSSNSNIVYNTQTLTSNISIPTISINNPSKLLTNVVVTSSNPTLAKTLNDAISISNNTIAWNSSLDWATLIQTYNNDSFTITINSYLQAISASNLINSVTKTFTFSYSETNPFSLSASSDTYNYNALSSNSVVFSVSDANSVNLANTSLSYSWYYNDSNNTSGSSFTNSSNSSSYTFTLPTNYTNSTIYVYAMVNLMNNNKVIGSFTTNIVALTITKTNITAPSLSISNLSNLATTYVYDTNSNLLNGGKSVGFALDLNNPDNLAISANVVGVTNGNDYLTIKNNVATFNTNGAKNIWSSNSSFYITFSVTKDGLTTTITTPIINIIVPNISVSVSNANTYVGNSSSSANVSVNSNISNTTIYNSTFIGSSANSSATSLMNKLTSSSNISSDLASMTTITNSINLASQSTAGNYDVASVFVISFEINNITYYLVTSSTSSLTVTKVPVAYSLAPTLTSGPSGTINYNNNTSINKLIYIFNLNNNSGVSASISINGVSLASSDYSSSTSNGLLIITINSGFSLTKANAITFTFTNSDNVSSSVNVNVSFNELTATLNSSNDTLTYNPTLKLSNNITFNVTGIVNSINYTYVWSYYDGVKWVAFSNTNSSFALDYANLPAISGNSLKIQVVLTPNTNDDLYNASAITLENTIALNEVNYKLPSNLTATLSQNYLYNVASGVTINSNNLSNDLSITISNPDSLTLNVTGNGVTINSSDYTISNNVLTFTSAFIKNLGDSNFNFTLTFSGTNSDGVSTSVTTNVISYYYINISASLDTISNILAGNNIVIAPTITSNMNSNVIKTSFNIANSSSSLSSSANATWSDTNYNQNISTSLAGTAYYMYYLQLQFSISGNEVIATITTNTVSSNVVAFNRISAGYTGGTSVTFWYNPIMGTSNSLSGGIAFSGPMDFSSVNSYKNIYLTYNWASTNAINSNTTFNNSEWNTGNILFNVDGAKVVSAANQTVSNVLMLNIRYNQYQSQIIPVNVIVQYVPSSSILQSFNVSSTSLNLNDPSNSVTFTSVASNSNAWSALNSNGEYMYQFQIVGKNIWIGSNSSSNENTNDTLTTTTSTITASQYINAYSDTSRSFQVEAVVYYYNTTTNTETAIYTSSPITINATKTGYAPQVISYSSNLNLGFNDVNQIYYNSSLNIASLGSYQFSVRSLANTSTINKVSVIAFSQINNTPTLTELPDLETILNNLLTNSSGVYTLDLNKLTASEIKRYFSSTTSTTYFYINVNYNDDLNTLSFDALDASLPIYSNLGILQNTIAFTITDSSTTPTFTITNNGGSIGSTTSSYIWNLQVSSDLSKYINILNSGEWNYHIEYASSGSSNYTSIITGSSFTWTSLNVVGSGGLSDGTYNIQVVLSNGSVTLTSSNTISLQFISPTPTGSIALANNQFATIGDMKVYNISSSIGQLTASATKATNITTSDWELPNISITNANNISLSYSITSSNSVMNMMLNQESSNLATFNSSNTSLTWTSNALDTLFDNMSRNEISQTVLIITITSQNGQSLTAYLTLNLINPITLSSSTKLTSANSTSGVINNNNGSTIYVNTASSENYTTGFTTPSISYLSDVNLTPNVSYYLSSTKYNIDNESSSLLKEIEAGSDVTNGVQWSNYTTANQTYYVYPVYSVTVNNTTYTYLLNAITLTTATPTVYLNVTNSNYTYTEYSDPDTSNMPILNINTNGWSIDGNTIDTNISGAGGFLTAFPSVLNGTNDKPEQVQLITDLTTVLANLGASSTSYSINNVVYSQNNNVNFVYDNGSFNITYDTNPITLTQGYTYNDDYTAISTSAFPYSLGDYYALDTTSSLLTDAVGGLLNLNGVTYDVTSSNLTNLASGNYTPFAALNIAMIEGDGYISSLTLTIPSNDLYLPNGHVVASSGDTTITTNTVNVYGASNSVLISSTSAEYNTTIPDYNLQLNIGSTWSNLPIYSQSSLSAITPSVANVASANKMVYNNSPLYFWFNNNNGSGPVTVNFGSSSDYRVFYNPDLTRGSLNNFAFYANYLWNVSPDATINVKLEYTLYLYVVSGSFANNNLTISFLPLPITTDVSIPMTFNS